MKTDEQPSATYLDIDQRWQIAKPPIHTTTCTECGMGLYHVRELHPFEACELFKESHDGAKVRKAMALWEDKA